nr:MAG TPA: helix-turn-helix domain protein [Caudoviricetes sp.]
MATEYLSITDVIERTGINRTTILYRIRENSKGFPQPDAIIRHNKLVTYGWLPETINNYIITNKKENKND